MRKIIVPGVILGILGIGFYLVSEGLPKRHTEPGRLPNRAVQSLGMEIQKRKIVRATLQGALFAKGEEMMEAQTVQDPEELKAMVDAILYSTRDASIAQETPIDCGSGDMPESIILWDSFGNPSAIVFHGSHAFQEHGAKLQQLVEKYRQRPDNWVKPYPDRKQ